jgi:RNA polymerase sigma-70 factor, ECF subfamily
MSSPFPAARFPTLPLGKERELVEPILQETRAPIEEVSDESLIARVRAGECEALALLFKRYVQVTRSVAVRILRDRAEAEDLVQDLFVFIQRKCAIFDSSKSSARSWIIQMTYHRAISRRRYLTTRQFYSHENVEAGSDMVGIPTANTDSSPDIAFGREDAERLFQSLSEDQRETLRLYFYEGYTLAEIALRLGQPHGNIRHHYYRALSKLRKQMFGITVRAGGPHGK